MNTLRIEGATESKNGALINVRVVGTPQTFQKNIKKIYTKEWLEKFSVEDIAYLGFLTALNFDGKRVDEFQTKDNVFTKNVAFIGVLFICFLLLSNLTAFKIGNVSIPFLAESIEFPVGLLFFPLTYFFGNVLTEVYGYKVARITIWCGFLCGIVMFLGFWISANFPPSESWLASTAGMQESYQLLSNAYTRAFVALSVAYFLGEFANSFALSKLKVFFKGKHLYARVVGSTAIGVTIDSTLFCTIAFYDVIPTASIVSMAITLILFKIAYEIAMLPVTYKLVAYLKSKDQIDYYDGTTRFNPFSFDVNAASQCS